jgi:hypothetical protein
MENHGEPTDEIKAAVKAKYPDRAVLHCEATNPDLETFHFLLTGPTRAEFEKMQQEILASKDRKDDTEKTAGVIDAARKATLAQVRWPERDQVIAIFDMYPLMPLQFMDTLGKAAGDSFEVRSKKV